MRPRYVIGSVSGYSLTGTHSTGASTSFAVYDRCDAHREVRSFYVVRGQTDTQREALAVAACNALNAKHEAWLREHKVWDGRGKPS